jgi:hypothetical protein
MCVCVCVCVCVSARVVLCCALVLEHCVCVCVCVYLHVLCCAVLNVVLDHFMCMYVRVFLRVCIHNIHVYCRSPAYACMYACACMPVHVCLCMYACACDVCPCMYACACMPTHACVLVHFYVYSCVNALCLCVQLPKFYVGISFLFLWEHIDSFSAEIYIHTYIHTCTHTYRVAVLVLKRYQQPDTAVTNGHNDQNENAHGPPEGEGSPAHVPSQTQIQTKKEAEGVHGQNDDGGTQSGDEDDDVLAVVKVPDGYFDENATGRPEVTEMVNQVLNAGAIGVCACVHVCMRVFLCVRACASECAYIIVVL